MIPTKDQMVYILDLCVIYHLCHIFQSENVKAQIPDLCHQLVTNCKNKLVTEQ